MIFFYTCHYFSLSCWGIKLKFWKDVSHEFVLLLEFLFVVVLRMALRGLHSYSCVDVWGETIEPIQCKQELLFCISYCMKFISEYKKKMFVLFRGHLYVAC